MLTADAKHLKPVLHAVTGRPSSPLVTARNYPQSRSKIAETNHLTTLFRNRYALQQKCRKKSELATNEHLAFHQYLGQTSLRIDETQWNNYRREINAVMKKYL